MGCCISQEDKEGRSRNEDIENQLRRDRMQMRNEVKMLLLGKETVEMIHVTAQLRQKANLSIVVCIMRLFMQTRG